MIECPRCLGFMHNCRLCKGRGKVDEDVYREWNREQSRADDDRDWAAERDRRSGAHFG